MLRRTTLLLCLTMAAVLARRPRSNPPA